MYLTGGSSTYSKVMFTHLLHYPREIITARGALVVDKGGKEYIDFTASLGAVLLGYSHPAVMFAIERQLQRGTLFPLPHPGEEEAAVIFCRLTGWEQVRWCKNGSDAVEAAVRIARHVTDRKLIVTNSYHGFHSDLVAATTGKSGGVLPSCVENLFPVGTPFALLEELHKEGDRIAAVVMEPVTPACTNWSLAEVQALCYRHSCLLIFDESITGFRYRLGSAVPAVRPDLACYGKAIANGMPLAVLAGPSAIMSLLKKEVFFSSTYAAEALSLAACVATLQELQTNSAIYSILDYNGRRLREGLRGITRGQPPRLNLDLLKYNHESFVDEMAERGILVGRDFFQMAAHNDQHITRALEVICQVRNSLSI